MLFQIPLSSSSSLDSIEELKYILAFSNWLRDVVKSDNLTREMFLEWGFPEKEVEVLFEEFKDSRDAYEVWKTRFKTVYRTLNATDRIGLGHDARIFLHTAKTTGMVGGKIFVFKCSITQLSLKRASDLKAVAFNLCYDTHEKLQRSEKHKNTSVDLWCSMWFCVVLCVGFCTGHFVMVPLNLTYLHYLRHSFFEHLFSLYIHT